MRVPIAAAAVGLGLGVLGASLFAPGDICAASSLGGDEVQGECLGALARVPVSRPRVIEAVRVEIAGRNNDVVLSSALEGFVSARACGDLVGLLDSLSLSTPGHVRPLVVAAVKCCQDGREYSLGVARNMAREP